jgi:hypothetical protein
VPNLIDQYLLFQLTQTAINDYNRGRMYLADFASRGKVPVSESIAEAVEIVLQKCQWNK